jgi:hypothetical protein
MFPQSRSAEGSRGFPGACEKFRTEVEEYRELDGERVLVLVHQRARQESGLDLGQMRSGHVTSAD